MTRNEITAHNPHRHRETRTPNTVMYCTAFVHSWHQDLVLNKARWLFCFLFFPPVKICKTRRGVVGPDQLRRGWVGRTTLKSRFFYSAGRKRRTELRKRTVTLDPARQRQRQHWGRRQGNLTTSGFFFFNVTFFSLETCVMAVMCCHEQRISPSSRWSNTRNLLPRHPVSVCVTSCFEMLIFLFFFFSLSFHIKLCLLATKQWSDGNDLPPAADFTTQQ